ncbi:unnamed protein product [Dicrocoelium dendriticum]|nr:unnamed protein product [Dicrocoelium dendriticum]
MFFKANVLWIQSLVNRWRANESNGAEVRTQLHDPDLSADNSDVPIPLAASYQELNWEQVKLISSGLTKVTIRQLSDNLPDSSSERSTFEA